MVINWVIAGISFTTLLILIYVSLFRDRPQIKTTVHQQGSTIVFTANNLTHKDIAINKWGYKLTNGEEVPTPCLYTILRGQSNTQRTNTERIKGTIKYFFIVETSGKTHRSKMPK